MSGSEKYPEALYIFTAHLSLHTQLQLTILLCVATIYIVRSLVTDSVFILVPHATCSYF